MLSRRSRSMATHPIPPSLIATLTPGKRTGRPDHNHSAQAVNDSWPNRVAPRATMGESMGRSPMPDDPTWSEMTVSVSSHAATTVSYTHLRAHETVLDLVCRLL